MTCLARDKSRLEDVADACRQLSSNQPGIIQCDVTDAGRMHTLLMQADEARPIDILIANAGIGGKDVIAPAVGEDGVLASKIFSVNMAGVVNTLTPIIPRMSQRGHGQIVIISSISAFVALPQSPVYSAAKAAAYSYGHGLRRLLKAQGVGVCVVSPGFIDTPMSRSLPFARPFLVDPDVAAKIVLSAADHGKADIIFPWQLRLAIGILRLLPVRLADRLIEAAGAQAATEIKETEC